MIFIGVDESGLGAWAGPATASAVAIFPEEAQRLYDAGVRDSKVLSDTRRRGLVDEILLSSLCAVVVEISQRSLEENFREAWRAGMQEAAARCGHPFRAEQLDVVFDGSIDTPLKVRVAKALPRGVVRFIPKADKKFPAVGAASILAKTIRNNRMLELASKYPEYGWDQNSGYHSEKHLAAILKYGITPAHRRIRPIRQLLETKQAKERK